MNRSDHQELAWDALAALGPLGLGALLVPLRSDVSSANVVLVLVTLVVAVAAFGGRRAGAIAAVSSALAFDFFHTRPYLGLTIDSADDVETTVLLLFVGLAVGQLALVGRRARSSAEASSGEIRRIHRVAEAAARGDDPADLILAAQAELLQLLGLQGCRFEALPYGKGYPQLERSGAIPRRVYRFVDDGFEMPLEGVELPVLGRGQELGRFVLEPTPGRGVTLEQRVVAVAVADQVGAALAVPRSRRSGTDG